MVFDRRAPGVPAYRPDILFPANKLIVECDGLYWHSEASNWEATDDRHYHARKLRAYEDAGYRALFFRSDEILGQPDKVRSIISNHLGKNRRVYARQCSIEDIDPAFFEENHLMGGGQGRCYGLVHCGEVVAGMRVRWVRKNYELDVSRFCTAPNTSVVGGYSKLTKHVWEVEEPEKIRTYIDRRYGQGHHLGRLGWSFVREEPSFRWTDGRQSFHRLKYGGNSGYLYDLVKIWDCGQARWEYTS